MILLLAAAIALQPFLTNLDRPVQLVGAHDGSQQLFIAEQNGLVLRYDGTRIAPQPFLDLRDVVQCCDNGGLLSIVFHPDYVHNGFMYVQYVNQNGDTAIARYTRSASDPTRGDEATAKVLLVAPQPKDNVPNHHGGTLRFGPDGMLYVSIGDGGAYVKVTNRAQELDHLLGKLLRIDVDHGDPYAIPPDNPFAGRADVRPEIFAYGLRNPWRFSFDGTDLLIGDVGQDSWEELDLLPLASARGANFGWPLREGMHCFDAARCDQPGLTPPQLEYPREQGCSVTGGFRYRGARWTSLRGTYVYGDFCSGRIWGATRDASGTWVSRELLKTSASIVSFAEDDEGEVYVIDYAGLVAKLVEAPLPRVRAVR